MCKVLDFSQLSSEQTKKLNKYAENYRTKYSSFVDDYSRDCGDINRKWWWKTPIASRNTFIDSSFCDFCLLRLMLDEIGEQIGNCSKDSHNIHNINKCVNNKSPKIVVIVPDKKFVVSLKKCLGESLNLQIKSKKNHSLKYVLSHNFFRIRGIFRLMYYACNVIQYTWFKKTDYSYLDNTNPIMISVYGEESEFKKNGFKDRYFPGIEKFTDYDCLYFLSTPICSKGGKKVVKNFLEMRGYIPYLVFSKCTDLFHIFLYMKKCFANKFEHILFDGMDVTALVTASVHKGRIDSNVWEGILKSEALKRMRKLCKLNPKMLIEWYEGQPSSNIFISEFRNIYKNVPTVAYLATPCGENCLGLYPSSQQVENHVSAEYYAIQGDGWMKRVIQFTDNVKLIHSPSFRYNESIDLASSNSLNDEKRENKALLVLPYFFDEATQLVKTFFKSNCINSFEEILIKNHPQNSNLTLSDYGMDEKDILAIKYRFITDPLSEITKKVSTVIAGTTTSGVELLLGGSSVIFFMAKGKLMNLFLPDGVANSMIAYDETDIDDCVKRTRGVGLSELERKELIRLSLVQVNVDTVRDFLSLKTI
jgi:hypothetical protein